MQPSTYAMAHGTAGRVTTASLSTVISILENYELALCGWDEEHECACPDDAELEDADAVASVVALLKKERDRRHRQSISRHVWREAEAHGWQRGNPHHRHLISEALERTMSGSIPSEEADA